MAGISLSVYAAVILASIALTVINRKCLQRCSRQLTCCSPGTIKAMSVATSFVGMVLTLVALASNDHAGSIPWSTLDSQGVQAFFGLQNAKFEYNSHSTHLAYGDDEAGNWGDTCKTSGGVASIFSAFTMICSFFIMLESMVEALISDPDTPCLLLLCIYGKGPAWTKLVMSASIPLLSFVALGSWLGGCHAELKNRQSEVILSVGFYLLVTVNLLGIVTFLVQLHLHLRGHFNANELDFGVTMDEYRRGSKMTLFGQNKDSAERLYMKEAKRQGRYRDAAI
eukprot:CAMPEP_0197526032 /NCGR_PEP_ID=MMETSP1318-20131121/15842_1 /TAXON_ID=552666 /ORGANISM="Partenskyella glossopodia, Strain RCC365" /LENGTH=281 /DNA_ID=CAMNT_0043079955 /DNA_START=170 /DNA_END=1015 /DNA_ORIENTATION=+